MSLMMSFSKLVGSSQMALEGLNYLPWIFNLDPEVV